MSELNNLFMRPWLVSIVEVVELESFTSKSTEKALPPLILRCHFSQHRQSYFDRSHESKNMDSIKVVLSTHLNLHQNVKKIVVTCSDWQTITR